MPCIHDHPHQFLILLHIINAGEVDAAAACKGIICWMTRLMPERPGSFCASLCRLLGRSVLNVALLRLRAASLCLRVIHQKSPRPENGSIHWLLESAKHSVEITIEENEEK